MSALPAVAYCFKDGIQVRYVRGTIDSEGFGHTAPLVLDAPGAGCYSATLVRRDNGRPAVAYNTLSSSGELELRFIRSADKTGGSWGAPMVLDSSGVGYSATLAVVNTIPHVRYFDQASTHLHGIKAQDTLGSDWFSRQVLDHSNLVGYGCRIADINGQPGVAYQDGGADPGALKYVWGF